MSLYEADRRGELMAAVNWHPQNWQKSIRTKALDGVEECVRGLMATQAKEDCPVDQGTLKGSIGTERDDANSCVYLGCGGAAEAYAFRQHQDMSINHRVGKAKFISGAVEMHAPKLKSYIEKHIK
jgi:hypothetical protein